MRGHGLHGMACAVKGGRGDSYPRFHAATCHTKKGQGGVPALYSLSEPLSIRIKGHHKSTAHHPPRLDSTRRTLAAVGGVSPGERIQAQFGAQLEAIIERVGPPGSFRWVIDLRHTLIHRGRRLQMSELRPVRSGIVGFDGRPVIRTDVIHQLPRDPGRSEVEMFLDATRPPVLTESAATTLLGVVTLGRHFLSCARRPIVISQIGAS